MSELSDTLFCFASESRVARFLQKDRKVLRFEQDRVAHALDELRVAGGKCANLAELIENGTDRAAYLNERAAFLAGLSMGLELAALGR